MPENSFRIYTQLFGRSSFISVILFEGTGNDVPTEFDDKESYLTGNVSSLGFENVEQKGMAVSQVAFYDGVTQDMSYEVMAVASNADGNISAVAVLEVKTNDTHAPEWIDADPYGTDAVLEDGAPITLVFDEDVIAGAGKDFMFSTLYSGLSDIPGTVEIDGNEVTVTPTAELPQGDYVFLSWPEGAVTDASGNMTSGVFSGVEGGYLIGMFTRRVRPPRAADSVAPATDSIASGGSITVTFDDDVAADADLTKDMIILEYYDADGVFDHSVTVDPATLAYAGGAVTIPQAESAPYGWWVDITIAEAAFDIGVYVPNAEITGSWWIY